jgi:hypothetical protein
LCRGSHDRRLAIEALFGCGFWLIRHAATRRFAGDH